MDIDNHPMAEWVLDIEHLRKTGKKRYVKYLNTYWQDDEIEFVKSKPSRKRVAYKKTQEKLRELIGLRRYRILDGRQFPGWVSACHQAGIDPKTAKKHLPKLHERWNDLSYIGDDEYMRYR